jgi:hypothetical protein
LQKYIRTIQQILRKVEKRLGHHPESFVGARKGVSSIPRKAETTLNIILNSYYKSAEETGDMNSAELFYFLEFIEKKKNWSETIRCMRFWAVAEKYRRLVWRIGSGIVAANSEENLKSNDKIESFSLSSHARLQKEVLKIYEEFINPDSTSGNIKKVNTTNLKSYQRYIKALSDPKSVFQADDYLCVVRTQKKVGQELQVVFNDFEHSTSYFQLSNVLEKERATRKGPKVKKFNIKSLDIVENSALISSLSKSLDSLVSGNKTSTTSEPKVFVTLEETYPEQQGATTTPLAEFPVDADDDDEIHAPGELYNHSSKLVEIGQSIERINLELECVNLLIWKENEMNFEITQNRNVIVLEQTRDLLAQEIGELYQTKTKLESQEIKEALMPGQCFVSIQEIEGESDTNRSGKLITYYLITVEQRDLMTGWTVKRRYSDFDDLHQQLKEEYAFVSDFELPGKTMGIFLKSKNEMRLGRMKALEVYLQVFKF